MLIYFYRLFLLTFSQIHKFMQAGSDVDAMCSLFYSIDEAYNFALISSVLLYPLKLAHTQV